MKLKFITSALMATLLGTLSVEASLLTILQTDGTKTTINLSEHPVMTFSGDYCVFESQSTSVSILRREIANFYIDNSTDGIENVPLRDVRAELLGPHSLCITGIDMTNVSVYDLGGRLVTAEITSVGDNTIVSLQTLPQGIYIVKYLNNAIKISKR